METLLLREAILKFPRKQDLKVLADLDMMWTMYHNNLPSCTLCIDNCGANTKSQAYLHIMEKS